MSKLVSLVSADTIPQHIRDDYPKFVAFINAYYEFLSEYSLDIEKLKDVDSVTEEPLFSFLKQELAKSFPSALINKNKFLRSVRELYNRKGTFSSIELLFKLFFNDTITISEPNKNILRASDGRWQQNSFFDLQRISGSINSTVGKQVKISFSNNFGNFELPALKTEVLDSTTLRVVLENIEFFKMNPDEIVEIFDYSNALLFKGILIKTNSRLRIASGGKYWSLGQIFSIPGTEKNTIARVTSVDNTGKILETEIYEYGYRHVENQIVGVYPFPGTPTSSSKLTRVLESIDNTDPDNPIYIFAYTLEIDDSTAGFAETTRGLSISPVNSYFSELYTDEDYQAEQVLNIFSTGILPPEPGEEAEDLSPEEWEASKAILEFRSDYVVREKGYYTVDTGHISNSEIRLQDSYFYQLFSYLIDTTVDVKVYKDVLSLIHPAGLKFFSNLNKVAVLDVQEEFSVYRTFSFGTEQLFADETEFTDSFVKNITLNKEESVSVSVGIPIFDATAFMEDSVSPLDEPELGLEKYIEDSAEIVDTSFDIGFYLADSIEMIDSIEQFIVQTTLGDTATIDDEPELSVNKYTEDTVNIVDEPELSVDKYTEDTISTDDSDIDTILS